MTEKLKAVILFDVQQMSIPGTFSFWTVTDLTRYLRELLESDDLLQGVWVQGEISNLSRPSSGHLYFTLKDSGASLRCVMWRSVAARLSLTLQDGMGVEVHGRIGIYEPQGQYQLYAEVIRSLGEGALFQEFMRLKALLEAEGLFAAARKRPIPEWPKRIGVVTSPTGAALRDILNTLRRRYPLAEVILAASPVQGHDAPPELVLALQGLNKVVKPDVILLARGGGSMEDLWAFNDERVVRAVVESAAPVIAGVGHETDFTLVDLAADLRAPTPTAAAELATPYTVVDLQTIMQDKVNLLEMRFINYANNLRDSRVGWSNRLMMASPDRLIRTHRQRLDESLRQLNAVQAHRLALVKTGVRGMLQRLAALDPRGVLRRGYAMVTRQQDGRLVSKMNQVNKGDDLRVRITDGSLEARVTDKQQEAG